jgi:hypothetical protein
MRNRRLNRASDGKVSESMYYLSVNCYDSEAEINAYINRLIHSYESLLPSLYFILIDY